MSTNSQDVDDKLPIDGSDVNAAEDFLLVRDGSVASGPALKKLLLNDVLNVPGVFGNVSAEELGHLDGVTGPIQPQLDGKLPTSGTAADVNPAGTSIAAALAGKMADTNTAVNAAIATNPAATREAAGAETTQIAWLERFGRHANGTQISNGAVTENGNTWAMVNQPGITYATVTGDALTSQPNDLLYIGGTVPCPGKRFSLTAIVELRASTTWVNAVGFEAGFVIGINNVGFSDLSNFLGEGINTQRPIHVSLTNVANVNGFYYQPRAGDAGVTEDATRTGLNIPRNKKFTISVMVIGDVATFSIAGYTKVFRHAGISDRISESGTGFFVEFGDLAESQDMFVLHDLWVNAPPLDANESSATRNQLLSEWFNSIQMDLPGRLRVAAAGFAANQEPLANSDNFATPGIAMVGYSAYTRPAPTVVSQLNGTSKTTTTALSSVANDNDGFRFTFTPRIEEEAVKTGAAIPAGSCIKHTVFGTFGANGNTKRIKVKRSAAGTTIFDSGNLTENGTAWTIEKTEWRTATGYAICVVFEYAGGKQQVYASDAGSFGAARGIYMTGVAAADVSVIYSRSEIMPSPSNF